MLDNEGVSLSLIVNARPLAFTAGVHIIEWKRMFLKCRKMKLCSKIHAMRSLRWRDRNHESKSLTKAIWDWKGCYHSDFSKSTDLTCLRKSREMQVKNAERRIQKLTFENEELLSIEVVGPFIHSITWIKKKYSFGSMSKAFFQIIFQDFFMFFTN